MAAVFVFARGLRYNRVTEKHKESEAETDQKESISGADEREGDSVCLHIKD